MSNMKITNVDTGSVVLDDAEYRDETLTVGGAVTVAEGTILARDSGTGKLVPFDPDDAGGVGHEVAKAVLPYAVTTTGAGDVAIRALVRGRVNANRLVIDDGASITADHLDQLRDYGITPVAVKQLGQYDTQD
jgi:hypothetical protein